MSALSGLGNKGESKAKGKFTSININNLYKGTSISPQKTNVTSGRHGLQSLGKVGTARRMPPPAHLPSLKSENSGNDPTVNLVPTGGPGWGAKEEKREGGTPPTSSQPQRATVQSQGQTSFKPTAPTVQGAPVVQGATNPTVSSSGATASSVSTTPGGSGVASQQTPRGTENRGAGGIAGIRSWSGIAGAPKKQGGIVDQNSPFFQEEFPTLATGGDEKSEQPLMKKEEENKESQYGPGLSLRPQNVASWREGGGRSALQQAQDMAQNENNQSTDSGSSQPSGGEGGSSPQPMHQPTQPQGMMPPPHHPGGPGGQPPRGPPMGPGGPMMPPQFRPGMMPPFMFRGFPPYPSNFPGMRPPPGPYPYPHDQRFRGPPPRGPPPQRQLSTEEVYHHPSILKQEDLKEFEKIENDGGWASSTGEVDYSEKLIFSDDEDDQNHKDGKDRGRAIGEKSRDSDKGREDDKPERERGHMPPYPREGGWVPPGQGQFRGPPVDWQRMPFDGRAMPGYPPRFRMPPPGTQRPQFPFPGPGGRPDERVLHPPEDARTPEDKDWRPEEREKRPDSRDRPGEEETELFYQRRKKKEEVTEAVERARVRKEEEERKIEAGKEKAREKLKIIEERLAERRKAEAAKTQKEESGEDTEKESPNKDKDRRVSSDEERTRTGSESSDKDKYRDNKASKQIQKIPPRLQQQRSQEQGPKAEQHPQGPHPGIRPPPPPWAYDPRAWGGMPPPWAGMSMHPQMRRRKESGGSDGERRTPEMPPFDPRMWGPYGPPPPGWEEAMRRGQPPPHPYYGYPVDYDRREYEREYHQKSELDEYSGWGEEDKSARQYKEGDLFKDVSSEADPTSRRSPRDPENKDRENKVQKDPFGGEETESKEKKTERIRTRSWGDWVEEEDDKNYGEWLEQKKDDYKEEIKEEEEKEESEKVSNEKETFGDKKVSKKDEHVDRRDQGRREKDHREYGRSDKRHEKDDYESRGRYNRDRDSWNQGYHGYNRSGSRKSGAPVPIPSQVVRDNIQATKSNFTSLKRSHSNVSNTSTGSAADRKTESPKDLPKTIEEKPQRAPSKETLKERGEKPYDGRQEEKHQPKSWPLPKNGVATDVSTKIGVGLEKENAIAEDRSVTDSKLDYQPPSPVIDEKKEKGFKKDDGSKVRDKREDDKPPVKKPRDDRHSSSRGRRSDEGLSDRGERSRSGRGRSANVREYVRGGGGRGRGRSGYSSGRGGGRETVGGRGRGREPKSATFDGVKGNVWETGIKVWEDRSSNAWDTNKNDNKSVGNMFESKPADNKSRHDPSEKSSAKPRDSTYSATAKSVHKDAESEHSGEEDWNDTRRRTHGGDTSDEVSLDENSPTSESSSDKTDSRENSVPKQPQPLTSRWADVARDKNQPQSVNQLPPQHIQQQQQQQMPQNQEINNQPPNKPPALMSLKLEKPEPKPQSFLDQNDHRRDGGRGRGRGRDRRRDRDRGGFDPQGRSNSMEFSGGGPPRSSGRGRSKGGSRGWEDGYQGGPDDMYHDSSRRGGSRGRGRFGSAPSDRVTSGGFGRPPNKSQDELEENQQRSPGSDIGRGGRRGRRSDRNSQPPRFARGGSGAGRGASRGGFGERGRGARGRGGSLPANSNRVTPKKSPPQQTLNNQNISAVDPANEGEEWETASESSDVATKGDKDNKDKKDIKKSFSSQRPSNDRQNRRGSDWKSGDGGRPNNRDSKKERSPPSSKVNGRNNSASNRNGKSPPLSKKDIVNVYRVEGVEHDDPVAVQSAINSAAKKQNMKKNSELSDVSKPLKQEKEKKDALANIDINNFASVVVIDDQPEVTFEDPNFLLESNEGFQEVYSKKAQKNKRAQDSSPPKVETPQGTLVQQSQPKKGGKESKKLRGVTSAEQKRLSKLPPRLAKVKAEEIKERKQMKIAKEHGGPGKSQQFETQPQQTQQNFVIENWDNEIASGIPVTSEMSSAANTMSTAQTSQFSTEAAPIPPVNAWDKPISLAVTAATVPAEVKFDKNDQHDSGIDVSEPLNSAGSSTRSSPSGEKKVRSDELLNKASEMNQQGQVPLPQRQPKVNMRVEKPAEVSPGLVQKPDSLNLTKKSVDPSKSKTNSVEPIQLPPSFKDAFNYKGMNSSDIKLDFTFDAELAKRTEEKGDGKAMSLEPPRPIPLPNQSRGATNAGLDSPTAHAIDNINMKIAAVKKVWDLPTVFEQGMNSSMSHPNSTTTVSISDPPNHSMSSAATNVQQQQQQQRQQQPAMSQHPSQSPNQQTHSLQQQPPPQSQGQHYNGLTASPQSHQTSGNVIEMQSPGQQRNTAAQQPYTSLMTQPNASPEPASAGASVQMVNQSSSAMLNQSNGSSILSQSSNAVEVSVSFANSTRDPVAAFTGANVEYNSFHDFMGTDGNNFKSKGEEYSKNGVAFSSVDVTPGISMGEKDYTNADLGDYTNVGTGEYIDTVSGEEIITEIPAMNYQGQMDVTSQSHHSEAGLIFSATEFTPMMNPLSMGETVQASALARSTGSKTGTEQSNVCKVKPQQHITSNSSGLLPVNHSPIPQQQTGNMPSSIPSPPTQQHGMFIATAQQAGSQYQPFQLGPSTQQHFTEPARQNIPHNPFSLTQPLTGGGPQALPTGSLPQQQQQQPGYNQHGHQQQQNLFLQASQQPEPYVAQQPPPQQTPSQLSTYRSQMMPQSQPQNTIMVSSTSSLMSATVKPPSSQNQYNLSGSQQQQSQKNNPLAALQYGQLMNSGSMPPPSLFVQYDPGQPINTNQPPPPPQQAASGGNQNTAGTVLGSQLVQHRIQSLGALPGPNSFASQQQGGGTQLQQTGFYQAQAQQSTYNMGQLQQVNAPTGLTIQGFGTPNLGIQIQPQAPVQPQSISALSGSSQLNKSAPPFKPASQKQQPTQQGTLHQQSTPSQHSQPPQPSQQHGSQPNTPTAQLGSTQNPLAPLFQAATGNLSASLPNINVPPPPLKPKLISEQQLSKPPPPLTSLGQIKDALPFSLNQSQTGRVSGLHGSQPSMHNSQQTHQTQQQKFKQATPFTGQQQQQQTQQHLQQQQTQLQQNMLNSNLMQAQIQLWQSLQRTSLIQPQQTASNRFTPTMPSGVTAATQPPAAHQQAQNPQSSSRSANVVGVGMGVSNVGRAVPGVPLSLREQQAKQRQDVLQVIQARNFLNPNNPVSASKGDGKNSSNGTTEIQAKEDPIKSTTPDSKEETETEAN